MGDTTQGVGKKSGLVTAKNTDIYVLYLGKGGAVLTFIYFLLKYRVLKDWLLFRAQFPLFLCCFPPLCEYPWTKPLKQWLQEY